MNVRVDVLEQVTDEVVAAYNHLLPQLSHSAVPLDRPTLSRLVSHEANTVLVARIEDRIVGTLTLVTFPSLSGLRARIEDVVVDESTRGQGIGAILTQEALHQARSAGARTVDLTSRPDRAAANHLYQRLGFAPRTSNIYRYTFD
ncbi:GNAT family N-acetyltransferase [Kribbella sp. NPDC051952]|uniref:GNAT family N-acetyltransferase n=1 Tax=Kribbella sp. NPDC051952 TaxID=3154851 RepID=UPI0034474FD3